MLGIGRGRKLQLLWGSVIVTILTKVLRRCAGSLAALVVAVAPVVPAQASYEDTNGFTFSNAGTPDGTGLSGRGFPDTRQNATVTSTLLPSGIVVSIAFAGNVVVRGTASPPAPVPISYTLLTNLNMQAAQSYSASAISVNAVPLITDYVPCTLVNTNPGTSTDCGTLGSFTVSFSQPVTNPIITFAGLGAIGGNTVLWSELILDPTSASAGLTLTKLTGTADLEVTGGTHVLPSVNTYPNTVCVGNGSSGANGPALCGSIQVNGTMSAVTFNVPYKAFNTTTVSNSYIMSVDGWGMVVSADPPALGVVKSHSGSFVAGSTGSYTVTVSNTGGSPTSGTVSLTDTAPTGMTVTAMSGTGWTCTTLPICTRSDALPASTAYPDLTVTVSIASDAAASLTNSVQASGGGATNTPTATDQTPIVRPVLGIVKSHSGSFVAGSTGSYTVTVSNTGSAATFAQVSVTDTAPTGMTVTAMSGTGWTCTTLPTCTRSDALAASAAYPVITVTVSIASDAAASLTNSAQAAGGGASNSPVANDPTVIVVRNQPIPALDPMALLALVLAMLAIGSAYARRTR